MGIDKKEQLSKKRRDVFLGNHFGPASILYEDNTDGDWVRWYDIKTILNNF